MTEKRVVVLVCAFFAVAFLLELNLTAIMCSDYYEKAQRQTVKTVDISMGRADIVDCNFKNITGTQTQIKTLVTSKATDLQTIFDNLKESDRQKFYKQIENTNRMVVDLEKPVENQPLYFTSKRYSQTNIAQHLIGYLDAEGNGLTGIERAFDDRLKDTGEKLSLELNVNGAGDIYGSAKKTFSHHPQVLSLTIDNSLQRICEAIAKEYIPNGSIVVMESKTGKIKAMVSTPSYDANNVSQYLNSPDSPLLNKALQSYEPGSVIKPLWAAAMLESGANPGATYYCDGVVTVNGHEYHCANNRAHGMVDMQGALTVSCNCYFIEMGIKNKPFILKQMANQVNFGSDLQLAEAVYTTQGSFPTLEEVKKLGQLSSVSFGQGDFLVSPVHVAACMNMFANNGVYVYPQIVQGMYDSVTNTLTENLYHYDAKQVITSQTAHAIKEMLINVVDEGAGGRAKPDYLTAGGKTGTAQTGKFQENEEEILIAWFSGFYPADDPKYTICINLYNGGESFYTTTPIFKKICDALYYLVFQQEQSPLDYLPENSDILEGQSTSQENTPQQSETTASHEQISSSSQQNSQISEEFIDNPASSNTASASQSQIFDSASQNITASQ